MSRAIAAFAAAGAQWAARGMLATADSSYYAPVTVIDGVRAHRVARTGLFVGAIGGIVACFANFGEDWLELRSLRAQRC